MRSIASTWTRTVHACTVLSLLMLAGGLMANTPTSSPTVSFDSQVTYSPADADGRYTYMIDFAEPAVVDQHRARSNSSFERSSSANVAVRAQLQALQSQRVAQIAQLLGRSASPSHYFLDLRNGIAMKLSPSEAERIRSVPGVRSIERERLYSIETFRGPDFIGAPAIWDGSATPEGSALTGELMVAAILDSGIPTLDHPSFADDPACGHGVGSVPSKVLSNLDCSATDVDGLCNGTTNLFDENGHGSHTASTTAGNRVTNAAVPSPELPAPFDAVSGVAYCAHVRSYDVCSAADGRSCGGADLAAGLASVLIHTDPAVIGAIPPVSVMNYSISGGRSPWADFDRTKLDLVDAGVFVAASAGNTSANEPDPVGLVSHRGPWVMSVAASTHDGQIFDGNISLAGGPQAVAALEGDGLALASTYTGQLRWAGDVDAANNLGCDPFPAAAFDGEAALIERGACSFEDKVNNAIAAGANFVVVFTDDRPPVSMAVASANTIPAFMTQRQPGLDMVTALAGGTAEVTVDPTPTGVIDPAAGDILAGFSLRGPTPSPLANLQKPNITAPGVNIYAADVVGNFGEPAGDEIYGFGFKSGTSMSSPHVAGAAVLVRQANPDWTVSEVKSAMQMTASRAGLKDDSATPWDWDDVGHGRVDLTQAAIAGLVMDETIANYLAADPGAGGDVTTLNTPDVRNVNCSPSCSFTRTVRNTSDVATSWTITPESFNPDLQIQVTPATFSFTGDLTETQTVTIDISPLTNLSGAIEFGQILFDEDGGLAPQAHFTVAISGSPAEPAAAAVDATDFTILVEEGGLSSASFNISNVGTGANVEDLTYSIEEASPAAVVLSNDREANPPQPVSLQLDGFTGSIARVGVADQSILWFNQFTPGALDLPFTLDTIQRIEFPNADDPILEGDLYDYYVWSDPDRIPGNGDEVLLTSELGIALGATPAIVNVALTTPVEITSDTGDVLIGIVNRTRRDGTFVANGETVSPPQGRSWIAFNFPGGAPTDPPNIGDAATFDTIDALGLPRNWIIRGLGTGGSACLTPADVPWLTVTPAGGTIAAGESQEVVLDIDSTGLATGSYEARVCVNTSDVDNPVFVLPVTLEVTVAGGLPTIQVSETSLSVPVDVLNPMGNTTFDIENVGTDLDLEWSIGEAEESEARSVFTQGDGTKGSAPAGIAFGALNGQRVVSSSEFAALPRRGVGPGQTLISVDGITTGGDYDSGDPDNSTLVLNIGEGNQIVGFGYEVNIETAANGSWLSESTVAIVTNQSDTTGLFVNPGFADGASSPPGGTDYSSDGLVFLADADIPPVLADAAGNVFLEWHESFDDDAGPDSTWSNVAVPVVLPAGFTVLVEAQPALCETPSDVSWLSVSPVSGTTIAGGLDSVTVNVDASGLEPGTYEAALCVESNDPVTPRVEIPVTMDVTVPVNAARIVGTVQGLGYCQADPILAAGAGIEIVGALETFNLTADANGAYSLFLDDANGPVDITASAPSHISDTQTGIAVTGETTTTVDFGLVLELPCAEVAPSGFSEVFTPGGPAMGNFALDIGNVLGGAQLEWGLQEAATAGLRYGEGVSGGGELIATTGTDRDSAVVVSERLPEAMPFVDAAVQGAPVVGNFTEVFDDITTLPGAGWSLQNLSEPLGTSDWFQGNPVSFEAHEGDPAAYIGANFNNTTGGTGTISNWLMTPEVDLFNGTELTFWTRVPSNNFPDRLEVRLSDSGSSTFAGASSTDVGDFDTLLLSIDPDLEGTYPVEWTQFTVTVSGLAAPTSGRFAFRYWVTSAGPEGSNSNYIGIDTVSLTQPNFCDAPSDIPWLSFTPFFGAAGIGETDTVDVSVDTTGLDAGTYDAFICVNTNDANAETIQVPFSIEVLGDSIYQDRFEG